MKKVFLIIWMLSLSAISYAQTFTVGTINYEVTSTSPATVEVKDSPSATGAVVIPATVDNGGTTYTVTSIGFEAFQDNQLTSATIPVGVTNIGNLAFQLNNLTSVSIPAGVTSIGSGAFQFNSLTSVTIPAAVASIGDFAFDSNRLTSVTIPAGVTSIGQRTFAGNLLTSVTIPASVTSIDSEAFNGNELASITIPASVTSIGGNAFAGNQLTSVTVGNPTPLTIDANVFNGSDLTMATLNVPAGAKAAYQAADVWKTFGTIVEPPGVGDLFTVGTINYAITSISPATVEVKVSPSATGDLVIPATVDNSGTTYSVTRIGDNAFLENQLTSVSIPAGVTSIGFSAFSRNQLTSVILPASVASIGEYAFNINQLTSIDIPANVTIIEEEVFSQNKLTSVVILAGVTSINSAAFLGNQLTSVSIPPSVTSIGDRAFEVNKLTSVTIPAGVTSIGNSAFASNQLTSITVENPTPLVIDVSVFEGATFANLTLNVPAGAVAAYQAADVWKTFGTIVAPPGVGDLFTVGTINYAITSISPATVEVKVSPSATGDLVIPATVDNSGTTYSVTSIGDNAFDNNNNNLNSVVVPTGVISIGSNAFSNNDGLFKINIPAGVTSIGNSAFESTRLDHVPIPASVTSIGDNAFQISDLESVTVVTQTPLVISASVFGTVLIGSLTLNVPANSVAAYKAAAVWKDFENIQFTVNSVNYGITSTSPATVEVRVSHSAAGDVVIPATVDNSGTTYTVTSIGDLAFRQNELTSVSIPAGVTSIGEAAFQFNQLTSINIPAGVTSIKRSAFAINKLTSVIIPAGVTIIDESVFTGNQLTNVIIPDGVTIISREAFDFNKLTSVTIPSSVTSIDEMAFNNNQLASIIIPASVTDIGNRAFAMNQLTSVSIPDGVTSISEGTFENNKLTSISLPSSVTSIEISAFANNSLTSFVIPGSITSIGNSAFYNNELASLTIPTSVISIDEHAFAKNQLTSITVENSTPITINANVFTDSDLSKATLNVPAGAKAAYQAADVWKTFGTIVAPPAVGDLFTVGTINYKITSISPATVEVQDSPSATGVMVIPASVDNNGSTYSVTSIGEEAFSENSLTSITIPDGVTKIGIKAFQHNQLTSVSIPASVTSMGHDAFFTNQLTSVTIPAGLTEIDGYAFGSNALTSVIIHEGVTSIGLGAFSDNKLTSISLSASLTSIRPEAFANNQLTSVTVENPTPVEIDANVFQGSDLSKATLNTPASAKTAYQAASVWKDFGIIKSIGPAVGDLFTVGTINYAITSLSPATVEVKDSPSATGIVVIPATVDNTGNTYNVTSIGELALEDNQLTSVTIPVGVTSISNLAFSNNQLTSISIPEGVISIGANAFERNQIKDLVIPTGVTSIGSNAFGLNFLTSVSIPASVTSIGSGAFFMNSLTSVTIPASVTSISDGTFSSNQLTSITMPGVTSIGDNAFRDNQLTSFTIPANVTSIGIEAFSNNQLTSVTIPSSVTSIGNDAFGSNQLTSVTVEHTTPLAIDASVFSGATLANLTLNVPAGAVAAYQAAAVWKDFGTIETPIAVGDLFTVGTINYVITSISPATVETKDSPSATGSVVIPATVDNSETTYNVTSIGNFSFESNELTSISIPVGVTTIGNSAFDSNQLTSISIPSSVTSIDARAFALNNLTGVTIPSSVTSMADNVFNGNPLTSVTVENTTPLVIDASVFSGTTLADITLVVPTGTVATYQAAAVWTDFGHIAEIMVNVVFASANAGTLTEAELTAAGITQTGLNADQLAIITSKIVSANPAPSTTADLQAIVDAAIEEESAVNAVITSATAGTLTEAELTAAGITQTGLSAGQIAIITARIVSANPVPNTTADLQAVVDGAIAEENAVNTVVTSATAGTLTEAELTAAGITQTGLNTDQIAIITTRIVSADPAPNTTADLQVIVDAGIAEESAVNTVVTAATAGTLSEAELTAAGITQTGLNADQLAVITTKIVSADPVPNTTADLQDIVDAAIAEESAVNAVVTSANADTLIEEELTAAGITQTDLNGDQISIITIKIVSADPVPNTTADLQTIVDAAIEEESAVNAVVASSVADTLTEEELLAAGISQTDLNADQIAVISLEVFFADPEPNTTAELQVIVDAAIVQENAVNIVVASANAGTLTEAELTAAGITQTDLTEDELVKISEEILFVDPAPNTTLELQDIVDFALSVISSVDDIVNNENQISVYPNPTSGAINIGSTDDVLSIEIYNMQGVLISTTPDLSNADNGIYLIRVTSKRGMQTKRIIKN